MVVVVVVVETAAGLVMAAAGVAGAGAAGAGAAGAGATCVMAAAGISMGAGIAPASCCCRRNSLLNGFRHTRHDGVYEVVHAWPKSNQSHTKALVEGI